MEVADLVCSLASVDDGTVDGCSATEPSSSR